MFQHVLFQALVRGAGILAEATPVKFLSSVGPFVNLQAGLVGESLITLGADHCIMTAVEFSHVNYYVPLSFTGLRANIALEHRISTHVLLFSVLFHTA